MNWWTSEYNAIAQRKCPDGIAKDRIVSRGKTYLVTNRGNDPEPRNSLQVNPTDDTMLSPWRQRRRLSTYLLTYLRAKSESTADQEFEAKETTMTSKTTSSALSAETAPGADDRGRHTRRREGSDVRTSEVAERTSRSIPGRSKIRHYRPRHLECTLQPPLGWRWGGFSQFDKTWEVGKRSICKMSMTPTY